MNGSSEQEQRRADVPLETPPVQHSHANDADDGEQSLSRDGTITTTAIPAPEQEQQEEEEEEDDEFEDLTLANELNDAVADMYTTVTGGSLTAAPNEREAYSGNNGHSVTNNNENEDDDDFLATELFGDDSDDNENEQQRAAADRQEEESFDEQDLFGAASDEEKPDVSDGMDVDQKLPLEEQIDMADIPSIRHRLRADGHSEMYLVDLPNFLRVDPQPFDPDTYDPSAQLEDHELKLRIENTIRWRYVMDESGHTSQQSNAHFVRWSDNSISLVLGDELIDVTAAPVAENQYLASLSKGDNMIRTEAPLRTKYMFRPFDTRGKTHQNLVSLRATKFRKVGKTKLMSMDKDPELLKLEAERAEAERIRARKKLDSKRRALKDKYAQRMTEGALEHFSDDEIDSGRGGRGGGSGGGYGRDEAGEDDDDLNDFVVDDEVVEHYNEEDEEAERRRDEAVANARRGALGDDAGGSGHISRDRETDRDRDRERERRKLEKERERKLRRMERESGELSDGESRQQRKKQRLADIGEESAAAAAASQSSQPSQSPTHHDDDIGQFSAAVRKPTRQRAIFSSDDEDDDDTPAATAAALQPTSDLAEPSADSCPSPHTIDFGQYTVAQIPNLSRYTPQRVSLTSCHCEPEPYKPLVELPPMPEHVVDLMRMPIPRFDPATRLLIDAATSVLSFVPYVGSIASKAAGATTKALLDKQTSQSIQASVNALTEQIEQEFRKMRDEITYESDRGHIESIKSKWKDLQNEAQTCLNARKGSDQRRLCLREIQQLYAGSIEQLVGDNMSSRRYEGAMPLLQDNAINTMLQTVEQFNATLTRFSDKATYAMQVIMQENIPQPFPPRLEHRMESDDKTPSAYQNRITKFTYAGGHSTMRDEWATLGSVTQTVAECRYKFAWNQECSTKVKWKTNAIADIDVPLSICYHETAQRTNVTIASRRSEVDKHLDIGPRAWVTVWDQICKGLMTAREVLLHELHVCPLPADDDDDKAH
ncbi:Paf1 complex component [Sorochytrium milnesiophthora]